MKNLPIGKQGIADILTTNQLYVDKTKQIHHLIDKGNLYFLSRPRRFGKSLTISTLSEIFKGNRELFKGLHIAEKTDYNWQAYPILQFSFNSFGHKTTVLREQMTRSIQKWAKKFEVTVEQTTLTEQFEDLVTKIAEKEGKPVVILVDEYDKPIVDFITNFEQAKINQEVLRDFFSPLKNLEIQGHLRFLFITGVSKFSKVSLFSDLNNLIDLSVSIMAHDLTGITQAELIEYFSAYIKRAAQKFKMTETELLEGVKIWYNGYSFDGDTKLYNPFSLLNFFNENRFRNFWFATGTPTFLVELIRDRGIEPQDLENKIVGDTFFDKFSLQALEMTGLLYQTGYLTIKSTIQKRYELNYNLGYPNMEVHKSLTHNLLEAFTYKPTSIVSEALIRMENALVAGEVAAFIAQLKILFPNIAHFHHPPTDKNLSQKSKNELVVAAKKNFDRWEGYFHSIIYLITAFMKLEVRSELVTHKGRLDLVAETAGFVYLMEFKLDQSAAAAIQQIKDKEYASGFLNTDKTLMLVGINFSKEEKNVENWKSEVVR